nr:degenerin deg-1-like [Dermacentor andersoni]
MAGAWGVVSKAFVWIACTAGFLYQASDVLQLYTRHAFTVTVYKEHGSRHIRFPAATICTEKCSSDSPPPDSPNCLDGPDDDNYHRVTLSTAIHWPTKGRLGCWERGILLKIYSFLQSLLLARASECRSKRDVLCGNNNSLCQGGSEALAERLLFDPELRNEAAYTPSELFNCRMRSLDEKCAAFSCTSMIRRTFYRTPFLMCYTFDLYQYSEPNHSFRSCEVPWLYEVELTVAWDALNTGPTDNVLKYPLIVHEPEVCPPEKLAPIHLRQGMRYTVSIAQRVFRRLPYPSASRCTDYRGRGRVGAYFGYMNYAVCLQDCLIQQELKTCGCAFHDHEFAATSFNGVLCSSEKKSKCVKMFSRDLNYNICKERCSQPCSEITYDVKLTGLADNEPGQNQSSFTARIRFATSSLTVYDYQRRLTEQEALAYIGGYLGIWLGVSLYSIYVVLETSLTAFLRNRFHVFKNLARA